MLSGELIRSAVILIILNTHMQSSSTNIAVAVRIRPLLPSELHSGHRVEKLIVDEEKKEVL